MIPALDQDAALGQAIGWGFIALLSTAAAVALWAWGTIRDRRR